jgi:hypothetical protein
MTLMDPFAPMVVELTDDERRLLTAGLTEWLGAARCSDAFALAMGFEDRADLFLQTKRLAAALRATQALTPREWTSVLLATEIVFVSAVVGSGLDWRSTVGLSDEETIHRLRALQRKMSSAGLLDVKIL